MRWIAGITVIGAILALSNGGMPTGAANPQIVLLSRDLSGGPSSGAWCPDVSANGRFVAFTSRDDNLVPGDTNHAEDIFLLDRQTGVTSRVNVDSSGRQSTGDSGCGWPKVSADGEHVAFQSSASDLVPNDANGSRGGPDIFVRDLADGRTVRVSVNSQGEEQSGNSTIYGGGISSNGRFIVFEASASNLAPDDFAGYDVFRHDRDVDEDGLFDEPGEVATELVSIGASGEPPNGDGRSPVMSDDARFVAFFSGASNLVSEDTELCTDIIATRNCYDIFVRDLLLGTTVRVSQNESGTGGNSDSWTPAISRNGRFVAFSSRASNLIAEDTNGSLDIFLYDGQQHALERVSLQADGSQSSGPSCWSELLFPCISIAEDGRQVAFESGAQLIGGDTNCESDIYVRDRSQGTTSRVSVDEAGNQLNGPSRQPVLAEGTLVFSSSATDIVSGLPQPTAQVYAVSDTSSTSVARVPPASNFGIPGICSSPEGDVDCDLDVDAVDAVQVLRFVASLRPRADCVLSRGNVQCYWEYGIDAVDALDILRYVAGILDELPNCHPGGGK